MTNKEAIEGVVEAFTKKLPGCMCKVYREECEHVTPDWLRTELTTLLAEEEARGRNKAVDYIERELGNVAPLGVLSAARQSENSEGNSK